MFLHILGREILVVLYFDYFLKDIVYRTALEVRNNVFLQIKGQACLLSSIMEAISSSETMDRPLTAHDKRLSFSEFLPTTLLAVCSGIT